MRTILLSKSWWLYFLLYFVIWYPVSFILFTSYQATASFYVFVTMHLFPPLWLLIVAFLYFRKARNDWNARFITAFGWLLIMLILAVLLVEPVYGYPWTAIINTQALMADWVMVVAVLVAGMIAYKPKTESLIPEGETGNYEDITKDHIGDR
jgi:hypothetical protein